MTADVVVVDHRDSYTYNLVHLIAAVTGRLPRVVQHDEVDVGEVVQHSHVVLSPGPGSPHSRNDFAVGREVLLDASRPVLGVCLGMQALVTTYGGELEAGHPVHGETAQIEHDETGLFAGLPQAFRAVRYHSLRVSRVPDALVVTASCDDAVVMGVRHRSLPQVGVQFHPESILSEHGEQLVRNFVESG